MERRRYWLFKSEPDEFSIDDLRRAPQGTQRWDGVRNYQARNFLRDHVKIGDGVLFYHSSTREPAVAGTATIVREGYPDPTASDPGSPYCDENHDPSRPRWYSVNLCFESKFVTPLTRGVLAGHPVLSGMMVMRRGMRLSIQKVRATQWRAVLKLARKLSSKADE